LDAAATNQVNIKAPKSSDHSLENEDIFAALGLSVDIQNATSSAGQSNKV
jgi:hypothetical protein